MLRVWLRDTEQQMSRMNLFCVAFVLLVPLLGPGQTALDPTAADEIRTLKLRVAELEGQNRAILDTLQAIKSKMGLEMAVSPAAQLTSPSPRTGPAIGTAELPSAPAQNAVHRGDLDVGGGNKLKFYGFLRLDVALDSQRPNSPQGPLFIESPDPGLGGKPDAGNYTMHPRLTRFGVDYSGPKVPGLGDADLSGKLELDFENGGSESRQIIRIRHAYLQLAKNDVSILAGQTWDVFSPLFPTVDNDTLLWNAGNVGDRRPQFRFSYDPKVGRGRWSITSATGLTGAVDAQDLDNNAYRDGEESGKPNFQGRIGYAQPLWVSRSEEHTSELQ